MNKFWKFLAFVGLISICWAGVPRHTGPVTSTEGRASSATFVLKDIKLVDFTTDLQNLNKAIVASQVINNPCGELGYLELGLGPVRQGWFNYLDAPGYARFIMSCHFAWGGDQFNCLDTLWGKRESGWNHYAGSPSRAYGIPQALPGNKMASAGSDWVWNPRTQDRWGLQYIRDTYGSPCGALGHSYRYGWY